MSPSGGQYILVLLEVLFQAFVERLLRPVREEHLMTTMFVRHTVSDYKTWRKAYDDFAPVQKAKGVTAEAVYRAVENPNDITVTHEFATIEAAQAFAESAELKNAMQNAGVAGAPTIWFTNKA
jgi:hypothetical protein